MTISRRMEKHLHCGVDFGEFFLLDVIVRKHKPAIVLLAPKKPENENTYFGMKIKGSGHWYISLEQLLGTCVDVGYMSKQRAKRLTRRYKKMKERDAA